jgi:hypothetical protein
MISDKTLHDIKRILVDKKKLDEDYAKLSKDIDIVFRDLMEDADAE